MASTALVPIKSVEIISTKNMHKNQALGTMLASNKAFSNDEKTAMIANLVALDKAIAKTNKKNLTFSDDIIDVEFSTNESKYLLSVPLGQGHFSKDFKHLVAIGSKELARVPISDKVSNDYEKNKLSFNIKGIKDFAKKAETLLANTFEGGIKTIEVLSHMSGDNECAKAFSDNLIKTYSTLDFSKFRASPSLQNTSKDKGQDFSLDVKNSFKELVNVSKAVPKAKSKQREITNHKDLGRNV